MITDRGANIALEVAHEEFCETTIGCPSPADAALWDAVFDTRSFRVHCTQDVAGVSLSGALVRSLRCLPKASANSLGSL